MPTTSASLISPIHNSTNWMFFIAFMVTVAVFGSDLWFELGIAWPVLYVPAILLAYRGSQEHNVLTITALVLVLTGVGLLNSPPGSELSKAVINRALSATVAISTAAVCIQSLRSRDAADTAHAEAERERLKLYALAEASHDGIIGITPDLKIALWNPAAQDIYRHKQSDPGVYRRNGAQGYPIEWLTDTPEDHKRLRGAMQAVREGRGDQTITITQQPPNTTDRVIRAIVSAAVSGTGDLLVFAVLMHDDTERVQAEQDRQRLNLALQQTVEQLETSNADLEQFTSVVSHDLQVPLRHMRTYLDLLARHHQAAPDANAAEWIGVISSAADRMTTLTRDLLAYAHVAATEIDYDKTDMGELVRSVVAGHDSVAEEVGASLHIAPLPRECVAIPLMRQLVSNLIGNALKYRSESPPEIAIFARDDEGRTVYCFQDNGIGIPDGQRATVFEPFKRAHAESGIPGTGVGLALCQTVISKHNGQIWVEPSPTGGSTFCFTLHEFAPGRELSAAASMVS